MHVWKAVAAIAVGVVSALSCGTGEDPLASFESSTCKSGHGAQVTFRASAEDYEGLQCIVWEPVEDYLRIDLFNFSGGCSVPWEGDARVTPDTADLRLIDPQEGGALCGSCLYDWSFELEGLDQSGDVTVRVFRDWEPGDGPDDAITVVLPLGEVTSGALCGYADGWLINQYAWNHERCGQEMMPCEVLDENDYCVCGTCEDPAVPCAEGLQCDLERTLCHAPCELDGDCGPGRSCQDGLCRPGDPW